MQKPNITQTLLAAAWLFASLTAVAETRALADFDVISYGVPFDVDLVVADEAFITLEGDEDTIDEIASEVENGTLTVSKDNRWFDWSDGEVHITIGYTELSELHMRGSGDAYAASMEAEDLHIRISGSAGVEIDSLISNDLQITISGSGNLNLNNLEADSMTTSIAGSGDVEVSGSVISQSVSIAGSGDHNARDLRSQEAEVSIKGSGDVEVWALASLDARIMGSGDIQYYGEPTVRERIMGSGNIMYRGENP